MRTFVVRGVVVVFGVCLALASLSLIGCGGEELGSEGKKCYPNGTCNDGLRCVSGYCVPEAGEGEGASAPGEGGPVKVAKAAGGQASPAKPALTYPASLTDLKSGPWQEGNTWIYRYTRDAKSASDLGGHADYYVTRKITSVRDVGELVVTYEEHGGPHDEHFRTREMRISSDCMTVAFKKGKQGKAFCVGGGLRDTTQGGMKLKVASWEQKKVSSDFDPAVGLVRLEKPGWGKRPERWELVGYTIGEVTGGRHDMVTPVCDWNISHKLPPPDDEKYQVKLAMSGDHGYKQIMPWTGFREEGGDWVPRGGSRFIPNDGKTMYVKQNLPLHRAKVWAANDGSMEMVVLHYEDTYDARVDFYRFADGTVNKKVLKYNKAVTTEPGKDRFAVLMKAEGEKCFVRISWKKTKPATAVDYDLSPDVLTRWRGSPFVNEGPKTAVNW